MDWTLAGEVTIIGLLTVSIVLAAMIGGLHLIGHLARLIDDRKNNNS